MTRSLEFAAITITVPDPDEISSLSGRFQAMGDALADSHDQLSMLTSPQAWSQWTGQAAVAFGQTVGQLPGQLAAAQESYYTVAAALSDYAAQLRPVVATLSFLAAQAEEAAGSLSGTQTARNQAFQQASDPSLAGWDARVTAARAVIDGLQAQARTQQAEMEALATRCVAQINQAMPGGHKNRSLLGWLGHDAAAVVHGAVGVADDLFVRPFTGLGHEAGKLVDHWTWEDVGKTLGDVAGVLGVVALIPGADVLAVPALIVVSGFAAGADLAAREEHERGATFTEAGLVAGQGLLAGLGAVFEAAGAAGSLADDADAQESGWALLKSGIKQMPDWADVKASLADTYNEVRPAMNEADGITLPSSEDVRGALNNVSDSLTGIANEWLHLGADGSALSPAATSYQHLGFVVRRTADGLTVFDSQLESNSQSSSQGPPA